MCCRALLIAAAIGLTAASASAQIRHPNHPGKKIEDVVTEPQKDNYGRPWMAWVTEAEATPRELPDATSPAVPRLAPIKFLQPFYIGASDQNYYLLIELGAGKKVVPIGWFRKDRVLTREHAVFNRTNLIYQKGMIVNTVDLLGDQSVKDNELPIRYTPNSEVKPDPKKTLRMFNIFFVYGEATDEKGVKHVLLGGYPQFDRDPDPARGGHITRVVIGWVPKDRVVEWNTRDALEWNQQSTLANETDRSNLYPNRKVDKDKPPKGEPRRTTPGAIYSNPAAATRGFEKKKPEHGDIVASESFNKNGEGYPMRFDAMRFVTLDWDLKFGPEPKPHPVAGKLHRVGVLGGWKNLDGSDGPSLQEIDDFRRKIADLEAEWASTDLVLLVDDTDSMKEWFLEVAETLKHLKGAILAGRAAAPIGMKPQVRIGLVFYSDVTATSKEPPVRPWRPKAAKPTDTQYLWDFDTHIDEMIQELDATPATRNLPRNQQKSNHDFKDGVDRPEMVFRAIRETIENAGFIPASKKMLVVIGDDGDRTEGDPGYDPAYAAQYNPRAIAAKLVPGGGRSAIEFYAVQVVNPKDKFQVAFAQQMNEIVRLHKGRDPESKTRVRAEYVTADKGTTLRETIENEYRRLAKEYLVDKQVLEDMLRGNEPTVLSPEREAIIRKRLEELGNPEMTWDKVRNRRGFQLFEIGYVWQKPDGIDQVRPRLLMNASELESIIKSLKRLDAPNLKDRPAPKELVKLLVDLMAGDFAPDGERDQWRADALLDLKTTDVGAVLRIRTGLKFNSALFNQLLDRINDQSYDVQELYDLYYIRDLLEDILNDRWYLYDEQVFKAGGEFRSWKRNDASLVQDATKTKRSFYLSGDRTTKWYWIDQWREWP